MNRTLRDTGQTAQIAGRTMAGAGTITSSHSAGSAAVLRVCPTVETLLGKWCHMVSVQMIIAHLKAPAVNLFKYSQRQNRQRAKYYYLLLIYPVVTDYTLG